MKKIIILTLIFSINLSCNMSQEKNIIYASIETNKGIIKTELFFEKTPITVANLEVFPPRSVSTCFAISN